LLDDLQAVTIQLGLAQQSVAGGHGLGRRWVAGWMNSGDGDTLTM
jgi:hypothetical protein